MQNLTSSIAFPGPEQLCVCRAGDIVSHLRAGSVRQLSHIPFVSRPKSCDLSLCHSAGLPAVPLRVTTLLKGQLVWLNSSLHFATTYSCCWMSSAAPLHLPAAEDDGGIWRWQGCLMAKLLCAWPVYFLLLHRYPCEAKTHPWDDAICLTHIEFHWCPQ